MGSSVRNQGAQDGNMARLSLETFEKGQFLNYYRPRNTFKMFQKRASQQHYDKTNVKQYGEVIIVNGYGYRKDLILRHI